MISDKVITPAQLKEKLGNKEELYIVDIRENTGGLKPIGSAFSIPASKIIDQLDRLPKNKTTILYCLHGADSFFLMNILITGYGFSDVLSLKSGLEGWYKFFNSQKQPKP